MAYDVTLVQFDGNIGGLLKNDVTGFPVLPTTFNFFLISLWVCLPNNGVSRPGFAVASSFMSINESPTGVGVTLKNNGGSPFFQGVFDGPVSNQRYNVLVSVNCSAQVVQVYVNDKPSTRVSGAGWTATGTFGQNVGQFAADLGASGGFQPAAADIWLVAPTGFVDLGIASNRRKFINTNLTPVDLGPTGANPFGSAPPIFFTVPPGGVANDFRTNFGTGGSPFGLAFGATLSLQAAHTCTLPTIPTVRPLVSIVGKSLP